MAKIQNVGLNLGQKIANPFKTSRNITTPNPFKNQDFEGNTLQYADVFEGFKGTSFKGSTSSKAKLVSSSVAGSMTKIRSLLPESIVNFVNRIGAGISSAWDYAKNTNVSDLKSVRAITNVMNTDIVELGRGISGSLSGVGHSISGKMSYLNKDITEVGSDIADKMSYLNKDITEVGSDIADKMSFLNKDITEFGIFNMLGFGKNLSERWNSVISNVHHAKATKDTPVLELRAMWLAEEAQNAERTVA